MVVSRLTQPIDSWLVQSGRLDKTSGLLALSMPGARTLLETIITLNVSFTVFTFGSLLVAIQVASGQMTPRIIATTLLRDNAIRYAVGFFVFTMLFALRALDQMEQSVHQFVTFIAQILGALSLVTFLYLIDYAARMLRPVSVVQRITTLGLKVIKDVFPNPTVGPPPATTRIAALSPRRTVCHEGNSGIVLAVNLEALVAHAHQLDGIIAFVPQVGDFVAVDEPLFRLYGGAENIDDRELRANVAFGTERTIEQDPTFAFRILVDIALKALSPAINDPTTATLAIDGLHRLLLAVGKKHLHGEEITDRMGNFRAVLRTSNWDDFVHLTFTEIRHFGGGSIQIARRLRSMIAVLIQTLPEHRHQSLCNELHLLDLTFEQHFPFPEDLALARTPDPQGLGSSRKPEEKTLCPVP
jgi:uncharacterized membrane protein